MQIIKKDLPILGPYRLDLIFSCVYDSSPKEGLDEDEDFVALVNTLLVMRTFNHHHRMNDTRRLFDLMDPIFKFELNSEGTTMWLSLILAVQELYGFSDREMKTLMRYVSVRK